MINANELRIGNMVLVDGKQIQVEDVSDDGINQEIESGYYGSWETNYDGRFYDWHGDKSGTIEGVIITPDILIACGFEKDKDGVFVIKKCLYWIDKNESEGLLQIALGYAPAINAPCTYIHQLQNLYFSLIGEELKVKL